MKKKVDFSFWVLLTGVCVVFSMSSCFKNLPKEKVVYSNDFEDSTRRITAYDFNGKAIVPVMPPVDFNGTKVSARYNNNRITLVLTKLPDHNAIKVQFDLYIFDKWDGDHVAPGNTAADIWQMKIDDYPFYQTTFSNTDSRQSFPNNYSASYPNPPRANAWVANLPGFCTSAGNATGSSMYRIEQTTSHFRDSVVLSCNDALQPLGSICQKSWAIDNISITAIKYP